ncbi:putative lipoprotein [Helicobacter pylori Hp A-11]|uniref:Putative lipoprotein n=1 Tax=Helicobacter pylori Hp A-11 TaxID=992035 RepID=N4TIV5_HELPX|nr:putative lipoprotein [Helicobacter pylori Hp A-11]
MAGYKKAGLILAVIFGFAMFFSGCKSDYAKKKIKEKGN